MEAGLGAKLAPSSEPDVMNYCWREYGNRVGAWRMLAMFDQLHLPLSVLVNTALYEHCPSLIKACTDRGAEIVAHGYSNAFSQSSMYADEENQMIGRGDKSYFAISAVTTSRLAFTLDSD